MTDESSAGGQPKYLTWLVKGGAGLAVVAAALVLLAGPGYRLELWDLGLAFGALGVGARGGLAAAGLCLIAAWLIHPWRSGPVRDGFVVALAGLVLAATVAYVPWAQREIARSVPPIHDITTDTDDPPAFVAVLGLRGEKANSTDYEGAELAAQQKAGYPDLGPLVLDLAPAEAFARAEAAARALGWEMVAADAVAGRLEATDTTFWFGFKDDIVVRVRAEGQGSRVDVRSNSRVGKSDVGINAKRIAAYLGELKR